MVRKLIERKARMCASFFTKISERVAKIHKSDNQSLSELKAVYKLSVQTRNFEIQQLINRNNFFMLFQGVLLAAVFSNQASKPYVEFLICLAGIIVSWHQTQVAAGAKYWQEWWELKTSEIENQLKQFYERQNQKDGVESNPDIPFITLFGFDSIESKEHHSRVQEKINKKSGLIEFMTNQMILKKHSVSRVPIRTGLTLLVAWTLLFLSTLEWSFIFNFISSLDSLISGHHFAQESNNNCNSCMTVPK